MAVTSWTQSELYWHRETPEQVGTAASVDLVKLIWGKWTIQHSCGQRRNNIGHLIFPFHDLNIVKLGYRSRSNTLTFGLLHYPNAIIMIIMFIALTLSFEWLTVLWSSERMKQSQESGNIFFTFPNNVDRSVGQTYGWELGCDTTLTYPLFYKTSVTRSCHTVLSHVTPTVTCPSHIRIQEITTKSLLFVGRLQCSTSPLGR